MASAFKYHAECAVKSIQPWKERTIKRVVPTMAPQAAKAEPDAAHSELHSPGPVAASYNEVGPD